ncbi:MAG: sensor histidine kinase [Terriglobales bacterium]
MKFQALRTIRGRLAVSYVALLSVTLLVFVAGASLLFWMLLTHQVYRSAIENVENTEGLLAFTPEGTLYLREDYHDTPQDRLVQERLLEVRDLNSGAVLYRNKKLGDRTLGGAPFPGEGTDYSRRRYRLSDGTRVLLVSHVHGLDGRQLVTRLALGEAPMFSRLKQFMAVLLLAIPLALAIVGITAFRVAARTLAPLDAMIGRAERITPKKLDERLPVVNPSDELGRLAVVINTLLQRIETSFNQLQRFTSDVSHELRTPLAVLRNVGEVGLQRPKAPSQYEEIIGSMLEEVNRLTRLVESLLTIARMDAGQVSLRSIELDVATLLRNCVGLLEVLAQEKGQNLSLEAAEGLLVKSDEVMLRQALLNILHNAIKYTQEGGAIEVRARGAEPNAVEITIADDGPGIPAEGRARIFERFYRAFADQTGSGLGLPIAKWIVEAHGGQLVCGASASGGCCFTIRLPLVQAGVAPPARVAVFDAH